MAYAYEPGLAQPRKGADQDADILKEFKVSLSSPILLLASSPPLVRRPTTRPRRAPAGTTYQFISSTLPAIAGSPLLGSLPHQQPGTSRTSNNPSPDRMSPTLLLSRLRQDGTPPPQRFRSLPSPQRVRPPAPVAPDSSNSAPTAHLGIFERSPERYLRSTCVVAGQSKFSYAIRARSACWPLGCMSTSSPAVKVQHA